jgi:WD40 repeat protein
VLSEANPEAQADNITPQSSPSPIPDPAGSPTPEPTASATLPEPTPAQPLDAIGLDNLDRLTPLFTLSGHKDDVNQIAFSHDGRLLASASDDGSIVIWDLVEERELRTLDGHTAAVASVSFSSDGSMLVSGGYDRTARLWQVADGALLKTVEGPFLGYVLEVAFVPESPEFVIADHLCDTQLRRAPTGILSQTLRQPNCTTREGTVVSWSLAFAPSYDTLVTGEGTFCCAGSLHWWNIDDPFQRPSLIEGYNVSVRDVAYSPDGETLAVALLGSPVFWLVDAETGDLIRTFEDHVYRVNGVAFSPDGSLIVSASRDRKLNVWTAEGPEPELSLVEHSDALNSAVFSPDGSLLASAGDDDLIIVWGIR